MREVTIKGIRQGILLVLPDDRAWEAVREDLESKLAAAAGLISGTKAHLDVGDRPVTAEQLEALGRELTERHQVELTALIGTHEQAREAGTACGLTLSEPSAVRPEPKRAEAAVAAASASAPAAPAAPAAERSRVVTSSEPEAPANNALYLRQTLRSGQSVRHDGNVVICGDVNPGAEVIATGDIMVFGTLRGVAHAGATGSEDAQIIAMNLRPTQIRIAGFIARSPDTAGAASRYPEVARVTGSEIHIVPLRD